jgi:hypothetical protein
MNPRPAASYRAARRNACLRPDLLAPSTWGPQWYFRGSRKAHGHHVSPRYEPYLIKPPVMKVISMVPVLVARKQPKVYRHAAAARA